MSVELICLVGVSLLLWLAIFVQQVQIDRVAGSKYALSNRTEAPPGANELTGRLRRLVRNHVEGLAVFAPLVLVAFAADVSNIWTQYSAIAYLALRTLHFVFYAGGVTPFRSFAWGVGFLVAVPVLTYGLISGIVG